MRQETSRETDILIHITKPRDVSDIMEMHARGFGTRGANCTREGEGTGRKGPGKQGRGTRFALVQLSLGLSTAEFRSQPAGKPQHF